MRERKRGSRGDRVADRWRRGRLHAIRWKVSLDLPKAAGVLGARWKGRVLSSRGVPRCVPDATRGSAGTMKRRTPDGPLASCRERRESRAPRRPRWYLPGIFLAHPREVAEDHKLPGDRSANQTPRFNVRWILLSATCSRFCRWVVDRVGPSARWITSLPPPRGIVSSLWSCLRCDHRVGLRSRVWPRGQCDSELWKVIIR